MTGVGETAVSETTDAAAVEVDSMSWFERFKGGPLNSTDLAGLILRLVFGVTLLGQAIPKIFSLSLFGRTTSTQEFADGIITFGGYDHAYALSCLLTATELIGGILLIVGFLTPFGAAAITGIMLQFISLQWPEGMFGHDDFVGFQGQLGILAVGVAIGYIGPGHFSADRALGWRLHGLRWGTFALAFGLAVGTFVIVVFGQGLGSGPPPAPF